MAEQILIKLYILHEDDDVDIIENLTSSLIQQFSDMEIDFINHIKSDERTERSKGDPITIGGIVLGIGVAVLPGIITFIQNWVTERTKVVIEAPNGAKVEFVSDKKLSKEEILALLKELNKVKK